MDGGFCTTKIHTCRRQWFWAATDAESNRRRCFCSWFHRKLSFDTQIQKCSTKMWNIRHFTLEKFVNVIDFIILKKTLCTAYPRAVHQTAHNDAFKKQSIAVIKFQSFSQALRSTCKLTPCMSRIYTNANSFIRFVLRVYYFQYNQITFHPFELILSNNPKPLCCTPYSICISKTLIKYWTIDIIIKMHNFIKRLFRSIVIWLMMWDWPCFHAT